MQGRIGAYKCDDGRNHKNDAPVASSLRKREKNVSCVVLMDYLVFEALIGFEKFGAVLLLGNQNQCVQ